MSLSNLAARTWIRAKIAWAWTVGFRPATDVEAANARLVAAVNGAYAADARAAAAEAEMRLLSDELHAARKALTVAEASLELRAMEIDSLTGIINRNQQRVDAEARTAAATNPTMASSRTSRPAPHLPGE